VVSSGWPPCSAEARKQQRIDLSASNTIAPAAVHKLNVGQVDVGGLTHALFGVAVSVPIKQ